MVPTYICHFYEYGKIYKLLFQIVKIHVCSSIDLTKKTDNK